MACAVYSYEHWQGWCLKPLRSISTLRGSESVVYVGGTAMVKSFPSWKPSVVFQHLKEKKTMCKLNTLFHSLLDCKVKGLRLSCSPWLPRTNPSTGLKIVNDFWVEGWSGLNLVLYFISWFSLGLTPYSTQMYLQLITFFINRNCSLKHLSLKGKKTLTSLDWQTLTPQWESNVLENKDSRTHEMLGSFEPSDFINVLLSALASTQLAKLGLVWEDLLIPLEAAV